METKTEINTSISVLSSITKPNQKLKFIIEDEEYEAENEIINKNVCSKNSLTAKSGFKAEEIFRTDNNIKIALETYFKFNIISMEKIQGKKYDTLLTFDDNTKLNIQNKK